MVDPTKYEWELGGTERELSELIAAFVRAAKPEVVVETGTYYGQTTRFIDNALRSNGEGHLWTVDNYVHPEFQKLRSTYNLGMTSFTEADSLEWAKSFDPPVPIGIAFVDCGDEPHRIQVAQELFPKMADGGLLMFHDTIFAAGYFDMLKSVFGQCSIHVEAINGLGIWQT